MLVRRLAPPALAVRFCHFQKYSITTRTHASGRKSHQPIVLISGGGIGGLTLALALRQRQVRVHIVESQKEEPTASAYLLTITATKIFQHLGVLDKMVQQAQIIEKLKVTNHRGERYGTLNYKKLSDEYSAPVIGISHAALSNILTEALRAPSGVPAVIIPRSTITRIDQTPDAVKVAFSGSLTTESYDAVIGADGAGSAVRTAGFDPVEFDIQANWVNMLIFDAIVPRTMLDSDAAISMLESANASDIWGRGRRLHIVPIGGNAVQLWGTVFSKYAVDKLNSGKRNFTQFHEEIIEHFRAHVSVKPFHALAERIAGMPKPKPVGRRGVAVEQFVLPATLSFPRMVSVKSRATGKIQWTNGRVALMGDAAHAFVPNAPYGAVLAVEDAYVLAQCLAPRGEGLRSDVQAGLEEYGMRRIERATEIAEAANEATASATASSSWAMFWRHWSLRWSYRDRKLLNRERRVIKVAADLLTAENAA